MNEEREEQRQEEPHEASEDRAGKDDLVEEVENDPARDPDDPELKG